jgi:transcriptional regulator with XRE-family HTH domain
MEEALHPLKVERKLRGWSQATVAQALNTTVRTVSRWEQRQALPYPFYREQLCRLFDKDARQLGFLPEHEEEEPVIEEQMAAWYDYIGM